MQLSEEQLIDQVNSGDHGALKELLVKYRGRAFGLCYSLVGNTEDAKDVLQEAMIKAYRNISRFRRGCSFYTWFYAILVNTARDFLRKKVRARQVSIDDIAQLPVTAQPLVLTEELNRLLEGAIGQLPEKQRLSFVMKHLNGMKINQIARVLNCRPGTVKMHLFRAVRNLRKKLAPLLAAAK